MTYREAQVLFQDKIEPLLKTAGLAEYKFQSDVIIQFLYEAEIESILDLCKQEQFEHLRNYIEVEASFTPSTLSAEGYYTSAATDVLWHVRSNCADLTISYPTAGVSTGLETKTVAKATNEFIPLSDVYKYITTSYQKHIFSSPKITLTNGVINSSEVQNQKWIIIVDSYTTLPTTPIKITYVKRPPSVLDSSNPLTYTSTFKVDPLIVRKVIDLAVQKALSTLSTDKPKG